jgi:hypothetical protein
MTNTNNSIDELSGKIEKMVAEHIAAVRIATQAAVARGVQMRSAVKNPALADALIWLWRGYQPSGI